MAPNKEKLISNSVVVQQPQAEPSSSSTSHNNDLLIRTTATAVHQVMRVEVASPPSQVASMPQSSSQAMTHNKFEKEVQTGNKFDEEVHKVFAHQHHLTEFVRLPKCLLQQSSSSMQFRLEEKEKMFIIHHIVMNHMFQFITKEVGTRPYDNGGYCLIEGPQGVGRVMHCTSQSALFTQNQQTVFCTFPHVLIGRLLQTTMSSLCGLLQRHSTMTETSSICSQRWISQMNIKFEN